VVFAFSILTQVAVVENPTPLPFLTPERYQAPEDYFSIGCLFDNHLKTTVFHNGDKLVKRRRLKVFLPTTMTTPTIAFMPMPDTLHSGGKAQDRWRYRQVFEAHKLIVSWTPAVP